CPAVLVVNLTIGDTQPYALGQHSWWGQILAIIVNLDEERGKKPPALDALTNLVNADLEKVNRCIVDRMHSPVALIPQLAGHIIAAGGKRLRPMLTLASAKLCGHKGDRHIRLA